MKRVPFVVLVLALAAGMLAPMSHGEKPKGEPSKLSTLMKSKLEHSQKVLEGIALYDYAEISSHADKLITISQQLEWKVLKTPEYELYSNEFRRNARDLVRRAKEKNLDGAALAYVDMTLTCVRCHKHVREIRSAYLDRSAADAVARLEKKE